MPAELPSGTVTLLFTDIEGSTRMLQELGREPYVLALTEHRRLLRDAFTSQGGVEVEMQGDSFHFAFPFARDAVAAAVAGQRALAEHAWESQPIKVRIGLHTGEPMQADGLYAGLDVHWAARVMSAGHGGQILLSARTAELVDGELRDGVRLVDLGQHRLKDLTAPQRLYQAGEGAFPPLKTLTSRLTNLPIQPNRLIGRDAEVAHVVDRLRSHETRLLTLTGPGGTGKTRLALHVAAELLDDFVDGVFFVPLSTVRDPARVLPALAEAIGAREQPNAPLLVTLTEFFAEKTLLLVLDNFEQVVDAAAEAASLLSQAPGLCALATSREPLRVSGEELYPVPTLSVPDLAEGASVHVDPAVELFAERARAASPQFALTAGNAPTVATICARLDGLPLAIELAAARVDMLSLAALARRLDRKLELLTGGARDTDERQRTLRATIDWSYELLDAEERRLLAAVSVFAGGCRTEAVQAVVDPEGDLDVDVFDGLCSLVSKSLIRARDDADGEPRFWMLATIREYALERLLETGERPELEQRHSYWCLGLAKRAASGIYSSSQLEWVQRLSAEHENLRVALAWALSHDGAAAQHFAVHLAEFWDLRGAMREGREWISAIRSTHPAADPGTDARLLLADGVVAGCAGEFSEARALFAEVVAAARHLGDDKLLARALDELAWAIAMTGEFESARAAAEEALSVGRNDPWIVASATHCRAVAMDDDYSPELFEAADRLFRELGDSFYRTRVVGNLGWTAMERGEYRRAAAHLEESRLLATAVDDVMQIANSGVDIAVCHYTLGELDEAAAALAEAIPILLRAPSRRIAAEALILAAAIACRRGAVPSGWRLVGAAAQIVDMAAWTKPEQRVLESVPGLATPEAMPSLAAGRTLTIESALREALALLDSDGVSEGMSVETAGRLA